MICTQPFSSSLTKVADAAGLRREESSARSRRAACPAGRRPEYSSSLNLFSWADAAAEEANPPCPRRIFARRNNYLATAAAATAPNVAVDESSNRTSVPVPPLQWTSRTHVTPTREGVGLFHANDTQTSHAPALARAAPSCSRPSSQPSWWHDETSVPREPVIISSRHGYRANLESTATREFASSGIRHITPPQHVDTAYGIRQVPHARGAQQQLQVVNVTASYLNNNNSNNNNIDTIDNDNENNELNQARQRPSSRVRPDKRDSSAVYDVLRYAGTREQLHCALLRQPVGQSGSARSQRRESTLLTSRERFAQCVRDHVQQRARGVAEFYVNLTRDRIGEVTAQTPRPQLSTWRLDESPARPVLTLARCLDQLISLTRIPVSLDDLASLVWGPCYRQTMRREESEVERTKPVTTMMHVDAADDARRETKDGDDGVCAVGNNEEENKESVSRAAAGSSAARQRSESPSIIALSSLDGSEMECVAEVEWGERPVLFRDFAAAFGAHADDSRLAIMRV